MTASKRVGSSVRPSAHRSRRSGAGRPGPALSSRRPSSRTPLAQRERRQDRRPRRALGAMPSRDGGNGTPSLHGCIAPNLFDKPGRQITSYQLEVDEKLA